MLAAKCDKCLELVDICQWGIHEVEYEKLLFNKTNKTHEFPKFYFVKKLYMFQAFSLPIIRSFLLYI